MPYRSFAYPLWLLVLSFCRIPLCDNVYISVLTYIPYALCLALLFVHCFDILRFLCFFIYLILIYYYSLDYCLPSNKIKKMRRCEEELGGERRDETVFSIYEKIHLTFSIKLIATTYWIFTRLPPPFHHYKKSTLISQFWTWKIKYQQQQTTLNYYIRLTNRKTTFIKLS